MNFVFDVDGTLCFDGQTIAAPIIEAIDGLLAAGHHVTFASARPIRDLLPVLPSHYDALPLIGGNGAFTMRNGTIETVAFQDNTTAALYSLIAQHHCTYLADSDWDYAYTGDVTHPIYHRIDHASANNVPLYELSTLCKLVLFDVHEALYEALEALPVVLHRYHRENIIDVSPLGIDKTRGLRHLNIDSFIAFGNDANDRCLFEQATYSVCVGDHVVGELADCVVAKEDVACKITALGQMWMGKITLSH